MRPRMPVTEDMIKAMTKYRAVSWAGDRYYVACDDKPPQSLDNPLPTMADAERLAKDYNLRGVLEMLDNRYLVDAIINDLPALPS